MIPLESQFGELVKLRGYALDLTQAAPNGQIAVTLYWEALSSFQDNFQSFVHLHDGTTMHGQSDGAPECDINPTTRWEPGQLVPDTHFVPISADVPIDQPIPILIGMYNLITLERLADPLRLDDVILTTP